MTSPHYFRNLDFLEFIFSHRIHRIPYHLRSAIYLHFTFYFIIKQPLSENRFFPKHPNDRPSDCLEYDADDDWDLQPSLSQSLIYDYLDYLILINRVLHLLPPRYRLNHFFTQYLMMLAYSTPTSFLQFSFFLRSQALLFLRFFIDQMNTHRHWRNSLDRFDISNLILIIYQGCLVICGNRAKILILCSYSHDTAIFLILI